MNVFWADVQRSHVTGSPQAALEGHLLCAHASQARRTIPSSSQVKGTRRKRGSHCVEGELPDVGCGKCESDSLPSPHHPWTLCGLASCFVDPDSNHTPRTQGLRYQSRLLLELQTHRSSHLQPSLLRCSARTSRSQSAKPDLQSPPHLPAAYVRFLFLFVFFFF